MSYESPTALKSHNKICITKPGLTQLFITLDVLIIFLLYNNCMIRNTEKYNNFNYIDKVLSATWD